MIHGLRAAHFKSKADYIQILWALEIAGGELGHPTLPLLIDEAAWTIDVVHYTDFTASYSSYMSINHHCYTNK
jgi:hypothetical protein